MFWRLRENCPQPTTLWRCADYRYADYRCADYRSATPAFSAYWIGAELVDSTTM